RPTLKTLIVVVAERHRDAHARQSISGRGRGFASAAVHHAALMALREQLSRQIGKDSERARVKCRESVALSNDRPFADLSAWQCARSLEAHAQDRPLGSFEPSQLKMPDRTDESDFFSSGQKSDEWLRLFPFCATEKLERYIGDR